MNTYTLQATEFHPDKEYDIDALLASIGSALVSHTIGTTPHWKTGTPLVDHRIVIDRSKMRDTVAHGYGYRYGFIVTIV